MKKNIILRLRILLVFMMTSLTLCAEEPVVFCIEFLNCKRIQIGNEWLKTHETFLSNKIIHWKNGRQYMRVRSLNNPKKVYGVTMEGFKEAKVQTLHDFLVKTNSTSSRGDMTSKHYSKVRHYLVDTLLFQAFDKLQSDVLIEAVWKKEDGTEQVTRLQRTSDNAFYIVTRDILGQGTYTDSILLDIRERPANNDWTNRVYRNIPIRCLPLVIK